LPSFPTRRSSDLVQRALQALYGSGQFADVSITQTQAGGKNVLVIHVHERPLLVKWAIRGVQRLSEHSVRDKVNLAEGRPLDPAGVERGRARIDSLYHAQGYYLARTKPLYVYEKDSSGVRVIFDIAEGRRVAIGQVDFQGNTQFTDEELETFYPFAGEQRTGLLGLGGKHPIVYFDDQTWQDATRKLQTLYYNNGYIYVNVRPDVLRRVGPDGKPVVDLRWVITEGQPA